MHPDGFKGGERLFEWAPFLAAWMCVSSSLGEKAMIRTLTRILTLILLSAAVSCGGGGGGGGGGSTSQVGILLRDAPVDDLSSFVVTTLGVRLVRADGTMTSNLLEGSRTHNLLELQGKAALLQIASTSSGAYTGVQVTFEPGSAEARDYRGQSLPVRMGATTAAADFPRPVSLGAGFTSIEVDVRLDDALRVDPLTTNGLLFVPVVNPTVPTGPGGQVVDEVDGIVRSIDAANRRFDADLFDADDGEPLGQLTVVVDGSTGLFDDDGDEFASIRDFFAALDVGTRFEADGMLRGTGTFLASFIQLEDDGGFPHVVKIHGMITALDRSAQRLRLSIDKVAKGKPLVRRALRALGNPPDIEVSFSRATIQIKGPNPFSGTPGDLEVGQKVKVRFSQFQTEPFPATRIKVADRRPEYQGEITDTTNLPRSFELTLRPGDVTLRGGQIGSGTPVTVELDGSERIYLKLDHEPELRPGQLQTGLRVRVHGSLNGAPSQPVLEADEIRVRPGELEGDVTGRGRARGSFVVDLDEEDEPFGGPALGSSVVIHVNADVLVEGDARSANQLFRLIDAGESIEVEVAGIGHGNGDVEAYFIDVEVEGRGGNGRDNDGDGDGDRDGDDDSDGDRDADGDRDGDNDRDFDRDDDD